MKYTCERLQLESWMQTVTCWFSSDVILVENSLTLRLQNASLQKHSQ